MVSSRYSPQTLSTWRAGKVPVIVPPRALLCPYNFTFKFADAPWSHKCRKLLLIWDKLGEQYESHKDIMIAKIDVTANDILSVGLDRSPFFTLFPAGSHYQARSSWGKLGRHSKAGAVLAPAQVAQGQRSPFTRKALVLFCSALASEWYCCQDAELEEKLFYCLILYMRLWQELRYHLLTWTTSP